MSNLITSKYPPVNGNICEKFTALTDNATPNMFEWSDELNGFVHFGTEIKVSYSFLEQYALFVWEKVDDKR